jgi:hypothetical protein
MLHYHPLIWHFSSIQTKSTPKKHITFGFGSFKKPSKNLQTVPLTRENGSIINSFHTAAPNSLKPSQCTPTHWELSKDTKSMAWSTVVWEWGDLNVTKQNKTTLLHSCIGKQNWNDNYPQSLSIMNPNLSPCIKQVHHTKPTTMICKLLDYWTELWWNS